ncbi:MAG: hypothetical protein IKC82_05980 [Lentisphaeria bacterium]|nr:hypothetical protein [Lentisphaeria bacterium]
MKHIFVGCGPVCGPLQGRIQTGEDVKKKLRFLREERLSPHEVKPDGFVDHFFAKKMVEVRGFEPPASASRTQRSSQTEPHGEAGPERKRRHPIISECLAEKS